MPFDWLTLLLALASVTWLIIALLPAALPAWPSVSLGVAALVASAQPGRPLPRGAGAFLAVAGILGGVAQIAAYWGIAQALP